MGLQFNGTDQYINVGIIPKTRTLSTSYWIRPNSHGTVCPFASGNSGGGDVDFVGIMFGNGGDTYLWTSDGVTDNYPANVLTGEWNSTNYPTDRFTNVIMTVDGLTIKLYRNGVLITTKTVNVENSGTAFNWIIAKPGEYDGFYFDGEISDVRYYNTTLTDTQALTIANMKGADHIVDGLVGRWLMMENPEGQRAPIFHNRLGSNSDILNSIAGVNGALNGGPQYSPVKFGNGVQWTSNDSLPIFQNIITAEQSNNPLTFEFWYKPLYDSDSGASYKILGLLSPGAPYSHIGEIEFINGTIRLLIYLPGEGTSYFYNFDVSTLWNANDILHIASVYDQNAGAGRRMRLFINGTELSTSSIAGDGTWTMTQGEDLWNWGWVSNGYINNLKIYNYAKTDFSDRFVEGTGIIDRSGTRLYRKPVLHNRLESANSVSTIGPNCVDVGTPVYVPGYYPGSNAVEYQDAYNHCTFPNAIQQGMTGTVEFWWKPNLSSNKNQIKIFNATGHDNSNIQFNFYVNVDGLHLTYYNDPDYWVNDNWSPAGLWDAGEWVHVAVTWNFMAALTQRWKTYYNGVKDTNFNARSPYDPASPLPMVPLDIGFNSGNPFPINGIVDNLKVYNYEKTDFSDRFDEYGYWQNKIQNNGKPVNAPVYKAAPLRLKSPRRSR